MKLIFQLILRIYPAPWRQRYLGEMKALLEDSGYAPRHLPNLLLAALRARVPSPALWLACTLAGVFAGCALMAVIPQTWRAEVDVPHAESPVQFAERVRRLMHPDSIGLFAQAYSLYPGWQETETWDAMLHRFSRRDIQIVQASRHRATVIFTYPDAAIAARLVRDLAIELGAQGQPAARVLPQYKLWLLVCLGGILGAATGILAQRHARVP